MKEKRQNKRIIKTINIQFCISATYPKKWDMSVIEDIGGGGIMFSVPNGLILKDIVVHLRIMIPEIRPDFVELEATVIDVKPIANSIYSEIRAKFINLSEANKEHLSVIESMIEKQERKAPKPL